MPRAGAEPASLNWHMGRATLSMMFMSISAETPGMACQPSPRDSLLLGPCREETAIAFLWGEREE